MIISQIKHFRIFLQGLPRFFRVRCVNAYRRVPDAGWMCVWILAGGIAYRLNPMYDASWWPHRSFISDFGALSMVFAFCHLNRCLFSWCFQRVSGQSQTMCLKRGFPFFAGAVVLLLAGAALFVTQADLVAEQDLLTVTQSESNSEQGVFDDPKFLKIVAEQMVIIAFYLLVIGIAREYIQTSRKDTKMQSFLRRFS